MLTVARLVPHQQVFLTVCITTDCLMVPALHQSLRVTGVTEVSIPLTLTDFPSRTVVDPHMSRRLRKERRRYRRKHRKRLLRSREPFARSMIVAVRIPLLLALYRCWFCICVSPLLFKPQKAKPQPRSQAILQRFCDMRSLWNCFSSLRYTWQQRKGII